MPTPNHSDEWELRRTRLSTSEAFPRDNVGISTTIVGWSFLKLATANFTMDFTLYFRGALSPVEGRMPIASFRAHLPSRSAARLLAASARLGLYFCSASFCASSSACRTITFQRPPSSR